MANSLETKTATGGFPLAAGELVNRTKTTAMAFRPKPYVVAAVPGALYRNLAYSLHFQIWRAAAWREAQPSTLLD